MNDSTTSPPSTPLVGASRGLGHAMAEELVKRGWRVVGAVHGDARTELHNMADRHPDRHPDRFTVEQVGTTVPGRLVALRERLEAPGWIRTALGGPSAPVTMAEAIPDVVSVVIEQQGRSGLHFLDRKGKAVSW